MEVLRRIHNTTRTVVAGVPLVDDDGRDVLVVVARIVYAVSDDGTVSLASQQRGLRPADVYNREHERSSLRYPTDLFAHKPGTDVILHGTAQPPAGGEATSMVVTLSVRGGDQALGKTVRVHGPRVFHQGALGVTPGPAAPLEPTPLVYEQAYGGADLDDEEPLVEWRNPVGSGVARRRHRLIGKPAPRLEDPDHPLTSRAPAPASFGPVASSWSPRRERAGSHDEGWRRQRAPLRPADFDPLHHVVASEGLWTEHPLLPDVTVVTEGLVPQGIWRFELPAYAPRFSAVVAGRVDELPTHLDTLAVDGDDGTVELSWRAKLALPRKSADIERIFVAEHRPETIGPVLRATVDSDGRRHLPVTF